MAAPTENYVDPAAGNDFTGTTFTDGAYTQSTKTLVKTNAFTNNLVGHLLWLTGTGVTPGLFKIATKSDNSTVVLATDLHPAGDLTDVGCTQHDGSSSLPFASLQGALDLCGRDTTNGDRINVKAGTATTLTKTLDLAVYGATAEATPLIIQGYTATAGDGGYGEVDGAATYGCFAGTEDNIHIKHMTMHNTGTANAVYLDDRCSVSYCEFYDCGAAPIRLGDYCFAEMNNIHDCSASGISYGAWNFVRYNYLKNGETSKFTSAIASTASSFGAKVYGNIISIDSSSKGIVDVRDGTHVANNTIFSAAGTGVGIDFTTAAQFNRTIENNYIEGFSGVGGIGIDFDTFKEWATIYRNNAIYNCTTAEANKPAGMFFVDADNQSLEATALAKSGADTFANRFTYFAPLAVIHGDAFPTGSRSDIGAVQHAEDYPDAGNVTTDDTTNGAAGTLTLPAEEDVESGVQYGAGGTEFTGTLAAGGSSPRIASMNGGLS